MARGGRGGRLYGSGVKESAVGRVNRAAPSSPLAPVQLYNRKDPSTLLLVDRPSTSTQHLD